jgi:hypothetical protein
MKMRGNTGGPASPMRLLEALADRFGAFEAVANSTVKLARLVPEDELPMDLQIAEAVLEFGTDLRDASHCANEWAREKGLCPARATTTHKEG